MSTPRQDFANRAMSTASAFNKLVGKLVREASNYAQIYSEWITAGDIEETLTRRQRDGVFAAVAIAACHVDSLNAESAAILEIAASSVHWETHKGAVKLWQELFPDKELPYFPKDPSGK